MYPNDPPAKPREGIVARSLGLVAKLLKRKNYLTARPLTGSSPQDGTSASYSLAKKRVCSDKKTCLSSDKTCLTDKVQTASDSSVELRRLTFAERVAAGINPNLAARGLGLNGSREARRPDVQALVERLRRPQPAPQPAQPAKPVPAAPTPILTCWGCGCRTPRWHTLHDYRYCNTCFPKALAADEAKPLQVLPDLTPVEPLLEFEKPLPPKPKADPGSDFWSAADGTKQLPSAPLPPWPVDPCDVREAEDTGTLVGQSGAIFWESDRAALVEQAKQALLARQGDHTAATPHEIARWKAPRSTNDE